MLIYRGLATKGIRNGKDPREEINNSTYLISLVHISSRIKIMSSSVMSRESIMHVWLSGQERRGDYGKNKATCDHEQECSQVST